MFNISEFVANKTGSVLFVRKDGAYFCSESWHGAHKKIFETKGTVEYIDLDNNYTTTNVTAKAEPENYSLTVRVPAKFADESKYLEITYSVSGGIVAEEVASQLYEEIANMGGGSVQPDWNQNDPEAADYVKNRTHYSEFGMTTLVETQTVNVESPEQAAFDAFPLELNVGSTYTVIWDGAEYKCVSYFAEGPNAPCIGNGTLGGLDGGNDEPFLIIARDGSTMLFAEAAGAHTIRIDGLKETVHTIDPKYLPTQKLVVDITTNDDGTYASSVSSADITAAVRAGVYVLARVNKGVNYPLSALWPAKEGGRCTFAGINMYAAAEPYFESYTVRQSGVTHNQFTFTAKE